MGQFKPMVKMETTEPSVELKLKKGGKVAKKADGGMMGSPAASMPPPMPARGGMMGAKAPMRPPLAMRRRAMRGMPSGAGPAGPIGGAAQMQASMPPSMPPPMPAAPMKKGGKADMSQDKAMVKKAFKQHDMQEHKGGKGTSLKLKHGGKMATGGVVNGQAGFATGGVAKSNAGGFKKGGKIKGMMDGGMAGSGMMDDGMPAAYKKGGAPKKAYAAGGTVNSGRPVAMPQGNKPASKPVRINELAGTYKAGGTVKMNGGGSSSDKGEDMSKGAYDKAQKYSRGVEDALNPLGMIKELAGKARDYFMPKKTADSVTKTKESVTVTPAKKRGGSVKC
jgi:hypothetical protein